MGFAMLGAFSKPRRHGLRRTMVLSGGRFLRSLVCLAPVGLAAGCNRATPIARRPATASEGRGGICRLDIRDPIIRIVSARDSTSNASISTVVISNVLIGGRAERDLAGFARPPRASRVSVSSGQLVCNVPCGLAGDPGEYTLTISGLGYRASELRLTAMYTHTEGACPASASGSTEVAVLLRPVAR